MPDKYQLIKIRNDTLYIVGRGLEREEVSSYPIISDEDDCDDIVSSRTYAVSDSDMSRIFGR